MQFVSITIANEFMLYRYMFLTVFLYCSCLVLHTFFAVVNTAAYLSLLFLFDVRIHLSNYMVT